MWLQATITREDLVRYLDELLPLRITLDHGDARARILDLGRPRRLEMIPSVGIRVETNAHIVWPVLGIEVPATIRSVQLVFEPRIEIDEHEDGEEEPSLGFRVFVEKLDVSHVPGIVESAIVDVINKELAQRGRLPSWPFTRMLDFRFDVPPALGFAGKLRLFASWADVRINEDGLTLAMSWRASVERESGADERHDDERALPPPSGKNAAEGAEGDARDAGLEAYPPDARATA